MCKALVQALLLVGVPADAAVGQIVVDGAPSPQLSPTRPIAAVYVDNGNVLCWNCRVLPNLRPSKLLMARDIPGSGGREKQNLD